MRVEGAVAALFISCAVALAEDTKPIDFSGDWWSYRCGLAVLVEQESLLTGLYIPSSGSEAGRKLPLIGYRSGIDLISFVVNFGRNGPITAWAGQHTFEGGAEKSRHGDQTKIVIRSEIFSRQGRRGPEHC
jgi:hypothetical protein